MGNGRCQYSKCLSFNFLHRTVPRVLQSGSYLRHGRVTKVLQSGSYLRHGRVTKAGDRILRAMLIQAVRVGVRRTEWMRTIYTTCRRDDPGRDKRAVVAVARRVAVRLWAKFRDYRRKNPQEPLLSSAA